MCILGVEIQGHERGKHGLSGVRMVIVNVCAKLFVIDDAVAFGVHLEKGALHDGYQFGIVETTASHHSHDF